MDAEKFIEIMNTIRKNGQKINFLSADFIKCEPTRDEKTGRSFSICYCFENGRWEAFTSFSGNDKPAAAVEPEPKNGVTEMKTNKFTIIEDSYFSLEDLTQTDHESQPDAATALAQANATISGPKRYTENRRFSLTPVILDAETTAERAGLLVEQLD